MIEQAVFKKGLKLMGNHFEISAVSNNEAWDNERIDDGIHEIRRIEKLLTTFNEERETSMIKRSAGMPPVAVSRETFDLIERSLRISRLTQGSFDISYGSIDKRLWNFDTNMKALPDKETAKKMVRLINYRNIILDHANCTVFLKEKGMRVGFGGIGKGYAAERARYIMKSSGVEGGIVNASGDLTTWGLQPNGKAWTIGIADPNHSDQSFSYMNVTDMAVATSGNYEKFVIINGKKYSHTIDPRTGLPISGIKSVTVITLNAEIADAMATPVMIMGIKAGLNLINQMKDIEAIVIDDNNRVFSSDNVRFS
jgi:thiamine biosynthesis lipoprotein